MDDINGTAAMGQRLGADGAEQLLKRAEMVCEWERKRIELVNQPALAARKAQFAIALEDVHLLKERLYHSEPAGNQRVLRGKITILWVIASVLMVSGFVLSLLTLEPYRLGLKGVVYCIGIAIVAPFLVHHTLDLLSNETVKRVATILACLAALASIVLLAAVRGNLMAQQVRQDSTSVVIEGEEDPSRGTSTKNSFYEDTVPLLQLVMALLAVAMEVGAGIATHEAQRLSAAVETDHKLLKEQLSEVHARLAALVEEITGRQNEALMFEAQFWRDFYWSTLKGAVVNAGRRFFLPLLLVFLFYPTVARAQQSIDLVVALDLTKSTDQTGPDGLTEFDKNIRGITQLLGHLPAGTALTIVGITGNSFVQPYLLLRAKLNSDAGYFGEKLRRGRQEVVIAWKRRSGRLKPTFTETDILGAFVLSTALFSQRPDASRKVLVIYSDMRQANSELNLEIRSRLSPTSALAEAERRGLVPDMRDVNVYVLGVATKKQIAEWEELRRFWAAYLTRAGASLRCYSVFRDSLEINR